jgi:hypothetical protein
MTRPTFSTKWAMPNRWTFQIKPIAEFIERHLPTHDGAVIVDPFSGTSEYATHANDLARGGVDAREYCNTLADQGVRADCVIFDPPYSPRQISECYKSVGIKATGKDTQNGALYASVRRAMKRMMKPGTVALSFGWQSSGFGKDFDTVEILLVQHGGAHNDTICVAQRAPEGGLFP